MKRKTKVYTLVLVLGCLFVLFSVVHLYARRFPKLVVTEAARIAAGRPYCIVIQPDHDTNELKKIGSISELSFYTVAWRHLTLSKYQRQYYGIPMHFGLICDNNGYLWSFRQKTFVKNSTYHAFLPAESRFLCRSHVELSDVLER